MSHSTFLLKKPRGSGEHQVKQLLDRAQNLIEALVLENQRLQAHVGCRHHVVGGSPTFSPNSPTARSCRPGPGAVSSMGQLWMKLDELKRENEELRRQRGYRSGDSSPLKDKAPGDVNSNDLSKTKTDNETLKNQVTLLQQNLRDLQTHHASTQEDQKRSKAALEAAQRSAEKARHDYKRLEAVRTAVRAELDSMKAENESLKHRLSVVAASNGKPAPRADSRLTENLNERCRPSNVALRYNTLESQQWVDAKEAVEESGNAWEESRIVHVLCQGLMGTYAAALQLYASVEFVISEILKRPTLAVSIIQSCLVSQCPKSGSLLSNDLGDLVKQRLRQTADNIDTDIVVLMAGEKHTPDTTACLNSVSSIHAVASYLRHCASITWQMVVQNPPMTLLADDSSFDDSKHKLWWSCDQSKARKVDMFVWPVLYDYHRGNVLVKGCVCAS